MRRGTPSAGGCLIRFDQWKRIFPVRNPGLGPVSRQSRHDATPPHRGSRHLRRGPSSRVTPRHRLMYAPVLTQGLAWRSWHCGFLTEAGDLPLVPQRVPTGACPPIRVRSPSLSMIRSKPASAYLSNHEVGRDQTSHPSPVPPGRHSVPTGWTVPGTTRPGKSLVTA